MSSMYKGLRFPREIISRCVWLHHRFTLSLREIELLMAERGIEVTHETIRTWCARFGPEYARRLRRHQPQGGDRWHLDEVFVTIGGVRKYWWRAVDQHGNVLDILIQGKRDGKAATRFFKKILKKQGRQPRVLIADTLRSYQVAHHTVISATEHRRNKYLNNRCENSHQPTRQREHAMKGFRTVGSAQRFLAAFSRISPHVRPSRHRMTATAHRTELAHCAGIGCGLFGETKWEFDHCAQFRRLDLAVLDRYFVDLQMTSRGNRYPLYYGRHQVDHPRSGILNNLTVPGTVLLCPKTAVSQNCCIPKLDSA